MGSTDFPAIFLWTHPRSVSSAMERVMLQRGDMRTLHEPFIYLYYIGDERKSLKYFDPDPQHPTSYEGIKAMILRAAEQSAVFVKDMCYFVSPYVGADKPFLRQVKNTFLIRTPQRSVPSYYKLDEEVTLEEIGIEAVYHHFELVADATGETPIVIDAEDLTGNPEGTMRAYCDALGLPFIAESLSWDSDALPSEWMHVAGWHSDLSGSGGMGTVKSKSVSLEDTPHLQKLCDHHMPFYEKLREYRIRPTPANQ